MKHFEGFTSIDYTVKSVRETKIVEFLKNLIMSALSSTNNGNGSFNSEFHITISKELAQL